jgi:hypothetical protein
MWLSLFCTIVLLNGCGASAPIHTTAHSEENSGDVRALVLRNMPLNSEQRCIGLTTVVEALAENELHAPQTEKAPQELASQMFQRLLSQESIRIPRTIEVNGKSEPVTSSAAIDLLGTLVADIYKEHHEQIAKSDNGAEKMLAARSNYLKSLDELNALLRADRDGLILLGGDGERSFPSGEVKPTTHAFLVHRNAHAELEVYDPNDPGHAIRLTTRNIGQLLQLEWTGRYRDTGDITTQAYFVVDLPKCIASYSANSPRKAVKTEGP